MGPRKLLRVALKNISAKFYMVTIYNPAQCMNGQNPNPSEYFENFKRPIVPKSVNSFHQDSGLH